MQCFLALLFLAAVVIVTALIIAGAIALIRRGKKDLHGSGSLGAAMQELESLFVESKKHVIEAERKEEGEAPSPSGEPPVK